MPPAPQTKIADEESAELLRLLVERAGHAILLLDAQGRILWWNPSAERILHLAGADIAGQAASVIFTPEDLSRGLDQLELAIARSDAIAEDDRWHVRSDGSRFWSSGALVPLRDPRGQLLGFGKIFRNRTDLKEQIERLREEADSAREGHANQKIGIATLAHELRNVLAGLMHGVKLMQSQGGAAQRREELTGMMEDQLTLVHRLTEDLLDISRIGAGKMQLQRQEIVLQEIVQHAVNAAMPRAQAKGVRLEMLAASGPITVFADSSRLQQVFGNLLDNAIKNTPEGGRIWVKVTAEDPEAVVHIQDTGVGIPSHMLEQIFDLFTQVEPVGVRHGLGIGLSLVRNLLALHGGSVQARSNGAGKGSEFTVRLPL